MKLNNIIILIFLIVVFNSNAQNNFLPDSILYNHLLEIEIEQDTNQTSALHIIFTNTTEDTVFMSQTFVINEEYNNLNHILIYFCDDRDSILQQNIKRFDNKKDSLICKYQIPRFLPEKISFSESKIIIPPNTQIVFPLKEYIGHKYIYVHIQAMVFSRNKGGFIKKDSNIIKVEKIKK